MFESVRLFGKVGVRVIVSFPTSAVMKFATFGQTCMILEVIFSCLFDCVW